MYIRILLTRNGRVGPGFGQGGKGTMVQPETVQPKTVGGKFEQSWVDGFFAARFPDRKLDRVLLVNPPDGDSGIFRFETAHRGRNTNFAPYGLGVIAENLRQCGVEVDICNLNHAVLKACVEAESEDAFDFDATWQRELDAVIDTFDPDLIGVSCMFTMTHKVFCQVCAHARAHGIPVAVGGVHVTNDIDHVLDDLPTVDFAFLREGDRAARLFVAVVRGDRESDALAQIVLNDPSGRMKFGGDVVPSADEMDIIPALDLMDVSESSVYGTIGSFYFLKDRGTRMATILTNRGCRAQCTFCSVRNFNGKGVRQRSIDSVVDELERLQNDYGIGHVMWLDDDLFKDHGRAIALYNEMVRRGLTLTWDASNGAIASSCTEEVVAAAVESGLIALHIGMESGNRQILRQIKKPGQPETFLKAAEVLRKHADLYSCAYVMLGFPGETKAMIQDTMDVAAEMDLDWYRISTLQPLPNTPIYDSMAEAGQLETKDSSEVRMALGSYGTVNERQKELEANPESFNQMFDSMADDKIPDGEQLADIWFNMNFQLNFHRLFGETRAEKFLQQSLMLRNLVDIVAPEHGFGLYFLGLMERKLTGRVSDETYTRLQAQIDDSPFWRPRLAAYGLDGAQLLT